MYSLVATGGTFDRFHAGHETLLRRAFEVGERVIIGITSEVWLTKEHKVLAEVIQSYEQRVIEVREFLKKAGFAGREIIAELNDVYGPTVLDARVEAIVVTRETRKGAVKINEGVSKCGHILHKGDSVVLDQPPTEPLDVLPEDIPLKILYEDGEIIVVDKPVGMVVHPAPGNRHGTLVNALLYHCRDLATTDNPFRPGLVHRLDKGTSGVMIVAKNEQALTGGTSREVASVSKEDAANLENILRKIC